MAIHAVQQRIGPLALALRRIRNAIRPRVSVYKMPAGVQADWNVPVKVRDGAVLRVNVFRPEGDAPVPVIMSAHPYNKDTLPARTRNGRGVDLQYRLFPQPHPISISEWTSWEAPDPGVWVPRGYAVVNVDLRGGGAAEGVGELFSDQEALDYYDVIEWAGTQPWSSGRVGLNGVSYLAISEYKVAALRPPHLAAICPWEGFSDLYRDFARPGGVREDGFTIIWDKGLKRGGVRTSTQFRKEIAARPERDEWYQSTVPDLERIEVPVLVCGSFSDQSLHTRGSFEVFRRAGSRLKSLYTHRDGKWCAFYSEEATATRSRFFDHTLKGLNNGWEKEAPVRLAIYDDGYEPIAIVDEEIWPPNDLHWRTLLLDAGAGILSEAPVDNSGAVAFRTHRDTAHFVWVVAEDIDMIGPMALRLHVEVRGAEDVLLFAGMRKIRAGVEMQFEGSFGFSGDMVSKGWQRGAHRELDQDLSSPAQPVHTHRIAQPLRSGEIVAVDIALLPQATRLRQGDVLRLEVRGRWHFPRDPFRGQFPSAYQRSPKAVCVLHTGDAFDARLLVGTRPVSVTAEKTRPTGAGTASSLVVPADDLSCKREGNGVC